MSGASATCFDRPAQQAIEPQVKREAMSALCHGLVVDSTFELSENITSAKRTHEVRPALLVGESSTLLLMYSLDIILYVSKYMILWIFSFQKCSVKVLNFSAMTTLVTS